MVISNHLEEVRSCVNENNFICLYAVLVTDQYRRGNVSCMYNAHLTVFNHAEFRVLFYSTVVVVEHSNKATVQYQSSA